MNTRKFLAGAGALVPMLLLAAFVAVGIARPPIVENIPDSGSQYSAVNRAVLDARDSLQAKGLRCADSESPSLTDNIVFERQDGTVEVVTFDEALELSSSKAGKVWYYCK